MTKFHPVTKEELDQIKNDCVHPETDTCKGCEFDSFEAPICRFKGANALMDEVVARADPLEVLEKLMKKDLKNNECFESESYDMAMRQGDGRYYLKVIKRLRENSQSVVEEGIQNGWWKIE